jgi:hypothetical protein
MSTQVFRRTVLLIALASLPGFAAAAGSQAGDNGRQPVGADNDSPRMAIPNQGTEAGYWQSYNSNGYYDPYRHYYVGTYPYYVAPPGYTYYVAPPAYTYYAPPPAYYVSPSYGSTYYAYNDAYRARALADCDNLPLAERPACRDAVVYGRR